VWRTSRFNFPSDPVGEGKRNNQAGFGANAGLVWDAFLVKELIGAA